MERALVSWPVACSARESSTKTGSVRMRPWKPQLQQKNAAFSVGSPAREAMGSSARTIQLEPQLQQKNVDNQFNQRRKKTSSVIHETCKEFGRMLHE